jgi:NMD protein affecting ribosome stability and mRNA decay
MFGCGSLHLFLLAAGLSISVESLLINEIVSHLSTSLVGTYISFFPLLKVRLVDAGFVWTEPHSKRLKVKLTIQKEVSCSLFLNMVKVHVVRMRD